jgi:hypothetical protein
MMKEGSIADAKPPLETTKGDSPVVDLEEPKESAKPNRPFPGWVKAGLLVLGLSLVSSAASIAVYDRYFATRIVAVDIKGFIALQRDLFVQGKIDDDQLRRNIESLERTIEEIPSNEVVIMGDAVVRNAKTIKP